MRNTDENLREPDAGMGLSQIGTGQVYLEWRDINYYVPAKREEVAEFREGKAKTSNDILESHPRSRSRAVKRILNGAYGYAKPNECVAIMGPSGSGKTSLLNVLAGRQVLSKGSFSEGQILANGAEFNKDLFGEVGSFVQ